MSSKHLLLFVFITSALYLCACGVGELPEPVTIVKTVEVPVQSQSPQVRIAELDLWEVSGHADAASEAFRHWDQSDPVEVPTDCAKCHSEYGYLDYLGADGTQAGVVDRTASVRSVISCYTCHNDATRELTSVVMPSGLEIDGLGSEARCIQCHQGRESKFSVDAAIAEAGVSEDVVSEELGFLNIHYYAAAATKYGTEAKGGYEYDGKLYDSFFVHVEGYESCSDCHDAHSLEIRVEQCSACHPEVETVEDLRDVRMPASLVDYDGDGDLAEGMFYEIAGLQAKLYEAVQAYAARVVGVPMVYESATYPYFFVDTNSDGELQAGEADITNRFASWTPRLLKAAYNYQVSIKDPGAFAHGGKYIVQLLIDSTEDLNQKLLVPIDLASTNRMDHGHFAGSEEAFRHWDGDDPAEVPASCSTCHTAEGLPLLINKSTSMNLDPSNGFLCSTCHDDLSSWTRYAVGSVTFPSGLSVDSGDPDMNLCMTCHQGRESGGAVLDALDGLAPDQPSASISFMNIHYFPAGATIYGSESGAGFEYPGKTYAGRFTHAKPLVGYDSCAECHDAHMLRVEYKRCVSCHDQVETYEDLQAIRGSSAGIDYDGDGDADEGLAREVQTMGEKLYAAIQAYADGRLNAPIVYDAHTYPYFFSDSNANNRPDAFETVYENRYQSWSPRLLKAAYNYQYAMKDPGAFAHNGEYIMQLIYDSVLDLGGDVIGMVRP